MEGIVKWYNNQKGIGFVSINEESDAFIHYTDLEKAGYKTLNEGDMLEYNLIETSKGFKAQDILKKENSNYEQC